MKASNEIKEFIKEHERFVPRPYLCPSGVPTVGYGNTRYLDGSKVKLSDPNISKIDAVLLFKKTIKVFSEGVSKLLTVDVNQNQFDALVSFAYNVGLGALKSSTLLRKVNQNPNDKNIKNQFLRWNKGRVNGRLKVFYGLTKRRRDEVNIYFS